MMRAYLKMALAMLLVGSYLVASKTILQYVPLFTAAFARQLFACMALGVYLASRQNRFHALGRKDCWILLLQAFVGIFLFSVFSLYGLRMTSGISANIIMATTPAGVAAVGRVLFGERINATTLACLTLALVGAVTTHFGDSGDAAYGGHAFIGSLLLILAVLSEAVFMTFGKLQSTTLPPIILSFLLTALGSLMFLPFALFELTTWKISAVPGYIWWLMVYSGVIITAFAVVLMNSAMQSVPTSSAAVFTALIPLSGVSLSILLLGDIFRPQHAVAAILILGAMLGIVFRVNIAKALGRQVVPSHGGQ